MDVIHFMQGAAALLVAHGRMTISSHDTFGRIDVHFCMGCVFQSGERYSMRSETGVILLIAEANELAAHPRGISSPGHLCMSFSIFRFCSVVVRSVPPRINRCL
jgi:hypothetical protein